MARAAWRLACFALRRNLAATLAFAGGLALFQATLIWGYRLIGGGAAVESVVTVLSPELRRALKIVPALQGGFGPREYVTLGLYHPIYLGLASAYAVSRAADGLAGSVERGGALLVLARPVARASVVLGEALALAIGLLAVLGAGFAGLALGAATVDLGPLPFDRYALAALLGWLLFAALGMVALLVAATQRRSASAAGLASALVLGGFVFDLLPLTGAPPLAWANPWHWYDPPGLVAGERAAWGDGLALAMLGGLAMLGAIGVWRRRSLP